MTRNYGRAPRGQRVNEATPQGRWQVLTMLAALTTRGLEAPMTIAEATDGDIFLAYLERVLCPRLRPGQVVIMDLGAGLALKSRHCPRPQIYAMNAKRKGLPQRTPQHPSYSRPQAIAALKAADRWAHWMSSQLDLQILPLSRLSKKLRTSASKM